MIDLSQAVTGTWSDNNTAHAGKGIYDPSQWAVVFKYSNVTIANGATVTFSNHYGYPPVVWLVQTNVTINGTVSVNGNNGTNTAPAQYRLTEPGPGGFRGGALNPAIGFGDGLGPGGGVSTGNGGAPGTYQSSYGNPQILPLIGGSGESNFRDTNTAVYSSGGSGAGVILIAAAGTISVNGQITATPGVDTGDANSASGAGGGIRVVASQITGTGAITATPQGRIRIEANAISSQLTVTPNVALVPPGPTPVIFPPASAPTVTILSVGGQSAPADPAANVISAPDIGLGTNRPTTVVLQTQNFPTTGTVSVRVVPIYGPSFVLSATNVSGNFDSATWQLTAQIPIGYCVFQPHATSN